MSEENSRDQLLAQDHVGNPQREYSEIARADPLSVYLLVNGSLEMGTGKAVSQAYQLAMWVFSDPELSDERRQELELWRDEGARVVVRLAETENIWERLLSEIPGTVLHDEGLTEVSHGAATCLCTWPMRRSEAPKLLAHKRLPLMR